MNKLQIISIPVGACDIISFAGKNHFGIRSETGPDSR